MTGRRRATTDNDHPVSSTTSSSSDDEDDQQRRENENENSETFDGDDLSPEQMDKLVQLQDLIGLDDLDVCRALLESNTWDLEATARQQFDPLEASVGNIPDRRRILRRRQDGEAGMLSNVGFLYRFGFLALELLSWPFRLVFRLISTIYNFNNELDSFISDNPQADVAKFRHEMDVLLGGGECHLDFFSGTYAEALEEAKRELKFLLVYLHCPAHPEVKPFCQRVFRDPQLHAFLADHQFLVWGASVETAEGLRVSHTLRETSYPFFAVIVLRQNRMVVVNRWEEGEEASLLSTLGKSVEDNEAYVIAARADRQERLANQTLRQEQDAAFRETLMQDQAKERMRREKEDAERKCQEEKLARIRAEEERQQRIRCAKIDLLDRIPSEPDVTDPDAIRIVIKLPGGQRLERRFNKTHSLKDLYYFIFCHPDAPDNFDVTTNFPRKILPCRPSNIMNQIIFGTTSSNEAAEDPPTFEYVNLGHSVMLFVNDLDA